MSSLPCLEVKFLISAAIFWISRSRGVTDPLDHVCVLLLRELCFLLKLVCVELPVELVLCESVCNQETD